MVHPFKSSASSSDPNLRYPRRVFRFDTTRLTLFVVDVESENGVIGEVVACQCRCTKTLGGFDCELLYQRLEWFHKPSLGLVLVEIVNNLLSRSKEFKAPEIIFQCFR